MLYFCPCSFSFYFAWPLCLISLSHFGGYLCIIYLFIFAVIPQPSAKSQTLEFMPVGKSLINITNNNMAMTGPSGIPDDTDLSSEVSIPNFSRISFKNHCIQRTTSPNICFFISIHHFHKTWDHLTFICFLNIHYNKYFKCLLIWIYFCKTLHLLFFNLNVNISARWQLNYEMLAIKAHLIV